MKNYLIAVDMEGVHGVVGVPYRGLACELDDYKVAVDSATKEVNAVIKALYDGGANKVYVWDNHGNLDNLDFNLIDSRAQKVIPKSNNFDRIDFVDGLDIKAVLFIGYHSREGSFNGVLAHTYDSTCVQYYKINGKQVGEYDMDAYMAAEYSIAPIFAACDNVCAEQVKAFNEKTITVITKIGTGRNSAIFRDEDELLKEIYSGVLDAFKTEVKVKKLEFPCEFEVRFTRTEFAKEMIERMVKDVPQITYGEDAHILKAEINNIKELKHML